MKISTAKRHNYNQTQDKSPSFVGQRLYALNLLQLSPNGKIKQIPAFFTILNDTSDFNLLKKIEQEWKKTRLGKLIINHFTEEYNHKNNWIEGKYFAIECPQFKKTKERIRALAEVNFLHDWCEVEYLQSASKLPPLKKLYGQGTALIRGLCQLALDKRISAINLISTPKSIKWYEKIGFKNISELSFSSFEATKPEYKSILKETSKKYGEIIPVG